jgi:hypothetical protein
MERTMEYPKSAITGEKRLIYQQPVLTQDVAVWVDRKELRNNASREMY